MGGIRAMEQIPTSAKASNTSHKMLSGVLSNCRKFVPEGYHQCTHKKTLRPPGTRDLQLGPFLLVPSTHWYLRSMFWPFFACAQYH